MLHGNRVIAIRARARRGWSIKKIALAFGVSRNTVRRYTRLGATPCSPGAKKSLDIPQELDLVRRIARRWDRRDPDELESELTDKLVEIYPQKTGVTHWKAFLTKTLDRAALNWLRARKRRERYSPSFERPPPSESEREPRVADVAAVFDVSASELLPIKRIRRVLPRFLRRVVDALIAENFNQTRAAWRLGVHRNTIRNAIRRIRIVLIRHGL